jgi:signal transduction histidine kinase
MSFARARFLHTEAFRLAAVYAGIFALSVLVLGSIVLVITDHAFREQVVQFSQSDIAAIQNGYDSEGVGEAREVVQQSMAAPGASDFFLLQQRGRRIAGNLPAMPPRTGIVSLRGAGDNHEILGVGKFLAPGLYAYSGSDLHRANLAQRQIVQTLAWLFAAALMMAVLGGAFVSRTFLRRSDAMATALRSIMDGDLAARVPLKGTQDELDRLAGAINEMLDRIVALMENLRQVTNDIAHDMRTPLTHLRQRLERARDEAASPGDYVAAIEATIVKADEILSLFAALLRIAQIEGGARRAAFTSFALAPVLHHLRDVFAAVAEAAGDRLSLAAEADVTIRGDRALVVQMVSNLIENAILHTPQGTSIAVSLVRSEGRAIVTVSDNGPGVPACEHEKLFQRLYRREASRSQPGYGLGLSLVAAIADLHGAVITVAVPVEGFSISMSFAALNSQT